MAVESSDDRAAMLDTDEFAVTATIGSNTFPGILDKDYVEVGGVGSTKPIFTCDEAVAVAAGAVVDATITISGNDYKIRNLETDGTGITVLILEAQ